MVPGALQGSATLSKRLGSLPEANVVCRDRVLHESILLESQVLWRRLQ